MTHSRRGRSDDTIDVLYVEDDPDDARLVQEAFRETDREVTLHVCSTGTEAVDYLRRRSADGALPTLVLLDLHLPDRDGCSVLETIREDPTLQCLPVIVLANSDLEEDVARCYDAHANAYLTKPTRPDEFVSLVEIVEEFWFDQVRLPPVR